MITIEKTFPGTIAYPLERLGDPEKLVFFDIETTGFSPEKNRIIEIGAVKVENGKITDRFSTFVNPKTTTPYISSAVSGRRETISASSSGLQTRKPRRPMS